jgi:hypothetical protein
MGWCRIRGDVVRNPNEGETGRGYSETLTKANDAETVACEERIESSTPRIGAAGMVLGLVSTPFRSRKVCTGAWSTRAT